MTIVMGEGSWTDGEGVIGEGGMLTDGEGGVDEGERVLRGGDVD